MNILTAPPLPWVPFITPHDQAVNTAAPALLAAFVWPNNHEEREVDDARNDLLPLCTSFSHFLCLCFPPPLVKSGSEVRVPLFVVFVNANNIPFPGMLLSAH